MLFEALNAAALYAATLLTIGACTALLLVPRLLRRPGEPVEAAAATAAIAAARKPIASAVVTGAVVLLVLQTLRLITHTITVFDVEDAFAWRALRVVAWQSRWGGGWRIQMAFAAAVVAVAIWNRRARTAISRTVLSGTIAATVFTLPLSGHAAASTVEVAIAGVHLLGAGVWIGTLAVLVWVSRLPGSRMRAAAGAVAFKTFSPLAMSGAGALVATGLLMIGLYLESPLAILTNAYGRLLATKLVLFAGISVCGFLNWRRARVDAPVMAAGWELGFAVLLLLVTGFLTQAAPP